MLNVPICSVSKYILLFIEKNINYCNQAPKYVNTEGTSWNKRKYLPYKSIQERRSMYLTKPFKCNLGLQ